MDSSAAAATPFSGRTAKIRFDDNVLVASTNSSCSGSLDADEEVSDQSPSSPGSEHSSAPGAFTEGRAAPFAADDAVSAAFASASLQQLDAAPKCMQCDKKVNGGSGGASAVTAGSRRRRTTSGSNADDLLRRHNKVVYTAGRPPWYDCQGTQLREPFFIGICGGSASGKTTVAKSIIELLDVPWVTLLNMDSFYKVLTEEQHHASIASEYNFDHPSAFDFDLLISTLRRLKEGKRVEVPVYNFTTHRRENYCKTMYGASVLILEGILTFHNKEILEMMDLKIFVDADADTRLARRLLRDITERGRDVDGVLKQCETFVKPSFDNFIAPTMQNADIIIPRGGENHVAIDLIVRHIKSRLYERGNGHRALLAMGLNGKSSMNGGAFKPPPSLYTLKQTPQLRCMHTMMRNRNTSRDEFVFYSHRVMRLLLEYALSLMPFGLNEITTPSNKTYFGKRRKVHKICGVSILRSGEAMETALREVVKDCTISKILIQTNPETLEPELYYLRLPKDIHQYHVLLLDTTVATGAAAIMGVRILLEHDVKQENIMLISLLMSEIGVSSVAYAFPDVKLITSAVDKHLSNNYHILPGIGNFGNRYFGTEIDDNDEAELSGIGGDGVSDADVDRSLIEDEIAIF